MPSLWTWLIVGPFSFLSNIIPSARSWSAVTSPAPLEAQPFRFLDLPVEICFMIYSQLAVRCVDVRVPGVDLPGCIVDASYVGYCFYPAMLRVSQEFKIEYSDYALPQMILCAYWLPRASHGPHRRERLARPGWPGCLTLPKKVIARLLYFCMVIDTPLSTPHCNYLPILNALISQLPMLKRSLFVHTLMLDGFERRRLNDPTELQRHGIWRQEVLDFLNLINDDRPPWKNIVVISRIQCLSYRSRRTVAERIAGTQAEADTPNARFQILDEEDEDTFRLDGLIVKFRGITPAASLLRTG